MPFVNPYQGKELKFPEKYKDEIEQFCQTRPGGGKKPSPDDSPFSRQVDFWFLAMCIGIKKNKKDNKSKLYRFITGEVLANNKTIVDMLGTVAVADTSDPYILGKPDEVIKMANEYAAAGVEELLHALKVGNDRPIWNLTDYMHQMISK